MEPNFNKCEKLATELLARQTLTSPKVDVRTLKYDKTIVFDTIQNYAKLVGLSVSAFLNINNKALDEGCMIYDKPSDTYIVLYNQNCKSLRRLNWTLAHEIGHIYLKHVINNEIQEIEAHYFAAQLLAPEYSLYQIANIKGKLTVDDIYTLFYVSREAAEKRLHTFSRKFSYRGGYADKLIWEMTKHDIVKYCEQWNSSPKLNPLPFTNDNSFNSIENAWLYNTI